MKNYKIAIVPGDGIGKEIIPAGLRVMNTVAEKYGFTLTTSSFPWGADYYKAKGVFITPDGLEELKHFDAIYFGAVGCPDVDDTLPAMLYTFKIRTTFHQYVNYRPVKLLPGVSSPLRYKQHEDIDFVVIRENNEGEFVQNGKILFPEEPHGIATDTSVFTRKGIERIAHYSFKLAQRRRKKVTNVTKSNTLIHSLAYWDKVIQEVSLFYPDVEYNKMYVDNASANFVLRPEIFDVIVTTNMIGDILSDLGGAIMGSLGFGPSGNINPERNYPSMFEPIHGSAPDIAGQNIANPIGAIWSAGLLLEHLGEFAAAESIYNGICETTKAGIFAKDLKGNASTTQIADAVISNIEQFVAA
ncbi:isocitrate/isopropylmalate dehydrogenase family protein [Chondrinema litorale]|uniref:isocitrate/isopropylmalate dehydrogenase family protein n=1 Tax=Chondrinema litorale TaxID=2994555 RepID=UPI002543D31F|nr:isocitrate/isopropylmalate family dehydrogenase [Chondrinema litorale]UZR97011.1 isocitrate/isopropylmalate family dehydrogenase [Chondrinema litorale]